MYELDGFSTATIARRSGQPVGLVRRLLHLSYLDENAERPGRVEKREV